MKNPPTISLLSGYGPSVVDTRSPALRMILPLSSVSLLPALRCPCSRMRSAHAMYSRVTWVATAGSAARCPLTGRCSRRMKLDMDLLLEVCGPGGNALPCFNVDRGGMEPTCRPDVPPEPTTRAVQRYVSGLSVLAPDRHPGRRLDRLRWGELRRIVEVEVDAVGEVGVGRRCRIGML